MIKRLCLLMLLTACTMQEEVMEKPVMEEDIARAPIAACESGDDDGIGGTGCEPVARQKMQY